MNCDNNNNDYRNGCDVLMMNIMIYTIKTLGMMMMMMIKIMIMDIMIMMSMMIPVGCSHDNYSIVRGVQSIHAGKDL